MTETENPKLPSLSPRHWVQAGVFLQKIVLWLVLPRGYVLGMVLARGETLIR